MATTFPLRAATCGDGVHRPDRARQQRDGALTRTRCRDCGCTLTRRESSRRWFLSGLLA